ncbi:MAG: tetratricopeptide repeat protein, partial [Gemmatimonadetes bacterium]|nr:tetratricopeptide repeat protein [Gemmatimonadota bacterium]
SRTVLDVAVLLIVLGFPAALIIAWYHGESGKQQLQKTEASLLLTLCVLAAIGTFRLSTAAENPGAQSARVDTDAIPAATIDLGERSVAVLPFVNSTGVDSLDWLGPGMSDMLTTNLAQTGALRVVSPQRLFELLRQEGHAETDRIPQERAMEIASRSGARTMVHGSILGTADDLALDAQLIDLSDGTIVAAERARGSDVFALADTVAERLASTLARGVEYQMAAAPEKSPMELTGDVDKFREYQAGVRTAWSQLDGDSLEVRYHLVDMLEMMPGREDEARRALEEIIQIAPDEAQAVGRLARIAIVQGDTAAADSLILRYSGLEKDERKVHTGSGQLLERAARFDEARDAYRQALRIEPDNTMLLDLLARTYLRANDPAGARAEMEAFLSGSMPTVESEAHLLIGDAWAWEGRFGEARAAYGRAAAVGEREGLPELEAAGRESSLWVDALLDPEVGVSRINRSVWTLLDLGRGETALNLVEAADRLYVRDSDRLYPVEFHTILYLKGRVYELLGKPRAAMAAYGKLLKDWGDVLGEIPRMSDAPERMSAIQAQWVEQGGRMPPPPGGAPRRGDPRTEVGVSSGSEATPRP